MPPVLIPIYQRAADAYGLGPQGPACWPAINAIETDFGTNLNTSSAGAIGWMQFMPSTWESYGVDANGDGDPDPYNPEDAIFAAASYLEAAGMPTDTYGAIYSYNHADWYVAEVLANAECYGADGRRRRRRLRRSRRSSKSSTATPAKPLAQARSRPPTSKPSRPPPPATDSASAASGRWPPSPASSPTSAAG